MHYSNTNLARYSHPRDTKQLHYIFAFDCLSSRRR